MSQYDRQDLINKVKEISKELNRDYLSRNEFVQISGISSSVIFRLFPTGRWAELVHAAGLQPHPKTQKQRIPDDELLARFHDWVVRTGSIPKPWKGFDKNAVKYSRAVYEKRFGGKEGLLIRYRKWLQVHHPNSNILEFPDVKLAGIEELAKAENLSPPRDNFVSQNRLEELRKIQSDKFDLRVLIRLCEELNHNYANGNYFSVSALTRNILDHVPPIFGRETFILVANNYKGGSFQKLMKRLQDSARNISNINMHRKIEVKEALPNDTQVNFSNELDVLLTEVVRVLRQ